MDTLRTFVTLILLTTTVSAQQTLLPSQKLVAPDGEFLDSFGRDVAVEGGTLVVTAHGDDSIGSAWIFTNSTGIWATSEKLTPSDGSIADDFGFTCSMGQDTILFGAPRDDDNQIDSGSVYVFTRHGTSWVEGPKLNAGDPSSGAKLGWSMDLSGTVLVVGAPFKDESETDTGAAYVFEDNGAGWVQTAKLTAPVPQAGASFGFGVGVSEDIVVVGAVNEDVNASDTGAAHVYRSIGGVWMFEQTLTAPDGLAGDWFGWCADLEGDLLVVGANHHSLPALNAGAAYAFRETGGVWTFEHKLQPASVGQYSLVGWSVAIQGDRVFTGGLGGAFSVGAIHEFQHDGIQWHELHELHTGEPNSGFFGANFGASLALDGNTILGGAFFAKGAVEDTGAAYTVQTDSVNTYCTGRPSSSGCINAISTSDLANQPIAGADDYDVTCNVVQGLKNGLLLCSLVGTASLPFSGGTLCVAPQVKRGTVQNSGGTSISSCDGTFATRVNDGSSLDPGPGQSAWYQYWYRNAQNGAGTLGTALSNAVQLDFQ